MHTHSLQSQNEARQANRCAPGHVRLRHAPFPTERATNCYQGTAQCTRVLWHSGTRSSRDLRILVGQEGGRARGGEEAHRGGTAAPAPAVVAAAARADRVRIECARHGRRAAGWVLQEREETWKALLQRSATCCKSMFRHITTRWHDRIVRSGTSDSKASCSPDRHRPLRQPRPWTALPSSASSPRKGTAHSSRASAVVCVRLDARHACACALVIPSDASASSRLRRGLWAQNCTH